MKTDGYVILFFTELLVVPDIPIGGIAGIPDVCPGGKHTPCKWSVVSFTEENGG